MAERREDPVTRNQAAFAPINVLYKHFHDAIRAELVSLETALGQLDTATVSGTLSADLLALKDRYGFLQQIYGYHSNVEDEARLYQSPGNPRVCMLTVMTDP